jgi:hypothetical protein
VGEKRYWIYSDSLERAVGLIDSLNIDQWTVLQWQGWSVRDWGEAVWLADLSKREKRAFRLLRLQGLSEEETASKMRLSPGGLRAVYLRAAKKVVFALNNLASRPVDPQIFFCWLEDVFHRPIYRSPSHSRAAAMEGKGGKVKQQWQ